MYWTVKMKMGKLFFIYTLLTLISFLMKMSLYGKIFVILSLPLIYIRFVNSIMNNFIINGIIFLIVFSLYLFWGNYVLLNVLAYIVSLILLVVVFMDYVNLESTYSFFSRENIPESEILYYLNTKFVLLEAIALGSFFVSVLVKIF